MIPSRGQRAAWAREFLESARHDFAKCLMNSIQELLMARTVFNRPDLPRSNYPISNAVRIGNLIFVSGFPGYDENVQVAKGDFAAQMRQALKNLIATLEYAGSSIDKIGKVNIYLDRRADIDELNEIYREFFGNDSSQWPARTTVEARLPRREFLIEIDCVAEA
jgi:2-iminobutanoate/2-iminopropanoate deaminase